jgi:precorrin-6A/cobalt-precorrin-6A reductase
MAWASHHDSDERKTIAGPAAGGQAKRPVSPRRLANTPQIEATLSLAGHTGNPAASPLAVRTGGFGGVSALSNI